MAREGKDWLEKEDNFIFKKLKEGKEVSEFSEQLKRKTESVQARMEELFANMHEEKTINEIATELGIDSAKVSAILGKEDDAVEEAVEDDLGEDEEVGEAEEEAEEEPAPPAKPAAASSKTPVKETPTTTPVKETPVKATPAKETPAKATPAKETPVKPTPAKETPAKETPAKPTPAKVTPTKDAPKLEVKKPETELEALTEIIELLKVQNALLAKK